MATLLLTLLLSNMHLQGQQEGLGMWFWPGCWGLWGREDLSPGLPSPFTPFTPSQQDELGDIQCLSVTNSMLSLLDMLTLSLDCSNFLGTLFCSLIMLHVWTGKPSIPGALVLLLVQTYCRINQDNAFKVLRSVIMLNILTLLLLFSHSVF